MKETRTIQISVLFFVLFFFINEAVSASSFSSLISFKKSDSGFQSFSPDTITDNQSFHSVQKTKHPAHPNPATKPGRHNQNTNSDIKDIIIRINNQEYSLVKNTVFWQNKPYLFFQAIEQNPVGELIIIPETPNSIKSIKILPSPDFTSLDSLVFIENSHYRIRLRFHDLKQNSFPVIIIAYTNNLNEASNIETKLFPYVITKLNYNDETIELFEGEEKIIDIPGSFIDNIFTDNNWHSLNNFEYKLIPSANNLRILIKASQTGSAELPILLNTINPFPDAFGQPHQQLNPLLIKMSVKPSRLQFINVDKEYLYHDNNQRRSEEIRIDYHSSFQLKKTYRIEDQQDNGGTLIAELYIKSFLSDNKILAEIKTYSLHRLTDGYLYIKDANRTMFISNFNIVNRPEISQIEILREGAEWTSNLSVFPGEKIEVKVQGSGLYDVNIQFDGCRQRLDSMRINDQVQFYEVVVPINIPRKKIILFMNRNITRHELLVREYQRPAPLDFVKINYGERDYRITETKFNKPVFYDQTIKDINLIFNPSEIDSESQLFGKQYISIEIRILDAKNQLLDLQTINNIVVCPGPGSPRYNFYGSQDCSQSTVVSLNEYLLRKTYLLEAFSQVIITVKHNEIKHGQTGHVKKITLFVERKNAFDIQVSFPTGLLVKEFKEPGIGSLSGISASILAELSFYDPKRIGYKKPYKAGVGFIALNAFNFRDSEDIKRDIGLVVMGSVEPMRKSTKFSVPIYLGFGYLLKQGDLFFIFGPGISISF